MHVLTPAGYWRIAVSLTLCFVGLAGRPGEAAGTASGQPVAYAVTPNSTLTAIDTGNHQILRTIALPGAGGYIVGTPDGKQLYVTGTDSADNSVVWVIDTQSYTVMVTIPLDAPADGMVIPADGKRVYVGASDFNGGDVTVIDTASNVVLTVLGDSETGEQGIAVSPDGKHVYVPMIGRASGEGGFDAFDTATLTRSKPAIQGADGSPVIQFYWAAVSPDSSKAYTRAAYTDTNGDGAGGDLIFSTTTNQEIGRAAVGVAQLSTPLPNSNILYGTATGSVVAYNTLTDAIIATVPVATTLSTLAVTPDGKQLYISNSNVQSIAILDTATNALSGSVAVAGATGLAIVPAPPPFVGVPPALTLQLSPAVVPPGAPATVNWTSSGATACTASGAWSGSVALQGSSTVSLAAPGRYTLTLTCTGPGGTSAKSATLTVIAGSTLGFSATDIPFGGNVVVSWTAFSGATSCQLASPFSPSGASVPVSGSQEFGPLQTVGPVRFDLGCTGPSGNQTVSGSILVYASGSFGYTRLVPPNNNVFALGTSGNPASDGGLGQGYAYDSQALPQPPTAFGQTFTLGTASKASGIWGQKIVLTGVRLSGLTLLATAVNGNQLNQKFVVTYSDGTTTTYTQSLSDWVATTATATFPGEDADHTSLPIVMQDRLTPAGAKQTKVTLIHGYQIPLDGTKVAMSLQLPNNRDVVVLALNETRAVQAAAESIAAVLNVSALATGGHASTDQRLAQGYAYDASGVPASVIADGQHFALGAANQPDAVSNATVRLPAKARVGLTLLATAVNGSQPNQTFVVTYQDGSTTVFKQSASDWHQAQNYVGESVVLNTGSRITPAGTRQAGVWNVYAYSLATNPTKKVVSLTLPKNRDVVVLAINSLTQ